ncbi:Pr6Pr family membrane protein [Jeongeupia naejangsanensis]|uniref:Pr6Pr family membrane protein n=1 Tax=Jeongeupia naejangsanensis TaxID=613195 RepID=A0ABS2BN92_9NEIS|nr:Pr6Pr family membrane protein [Jeongeupia naejangsanensis]MBM3117063.1 Pr6Pr family membrane protein [Jeongeupia naejangsanensis]
MTRPSSTARSRANRLELLLGLTAWFAVLARLGLTVSAELAQGHTLLAALSRFFDFFTNLSMLLLALVLTAAWLGPQGRLARWLWRPGVRAASLVYVLVVAVTYEVLLRHLWAPRGLEFVVDLLLHDVLPAAYLCYWLGYAPAGTLRWRDAFRWLIWPVAYFGYVLIRGGLLAHYPYPFFNVASYGYGPVLWNAAAFAFAFAATGLLIVALDHRLAPQPA